MMKRIALLSVCLAAAGAGYTAYPEEFEQSANVAARASQRVWAGVEANPVPVFIALGTFLLTIVYHKAKGKSLRESVEVAATRVTVVPVPAGSLAEDDNAVVRRAKARAMRAQLLSDQINLENRVRKLPDAVRNAEKESCYTEQAVTEAEAALAHAERTLAARRKAHDEAVARLEAVRKAKAEGDSELAEIAVELKKLADLV